MTHSFRINIPRSAWWSANDRLHWAVKAERTRFVRQLAKSAAIAAGTGPQNAVELTIEVHYPTNRAADPHNVASTVIKAAIDGALVDSGILPDDNSEHLLSTKIIRGPKTGEKRQYALTLHITQTAH